MAMHGSNTRKQDPSARNAKIIKIMVAGICVCLAFGAGFFVRGEESLLKAVGFSSMAVDVEQNPGATVAGSTYNSLAARVAEVEGILENDSLDSYDLDAATTDTLTAFTEATKDKYLRYYDADRYAAYVKENSGKYAGIGVLFSEYQGDAFAVDVLEGSVAATAGVKVGDYVVAIDGDRSQDWSLTETVNAVARDSGDSVVITWRRPASLEAEGGQEFTTTLVCSEYVAPNVETELQNEVGYISLKQITQNSAALVKKAVQDLEAQGAKAYVLDIRNNPGGYLTQAVDIASLFVKSGVIVGVQTKESQVTTKVATGSVITDAPLVVVVNGKTGAAAEVLATALKDNSRASVVGTTSMGKGSVQVVRSLSFGGALRYTAALYKSPLGHDIDNVGVVPDISMDAAEEGDNQKSLAVETAQSLIPVL